MWSAVTVALDTTKIVGTRPIAKAPHDVDQVQPSSYPCKPPGRRFCERSCFRQIGFAECHTWISLSSRTREDRSRPRNDSHRHADGREVVRPACDGEELADAAVRGGIGRHV